MNEEYIKKLEKALDLACCELEQADDKLREFYSSFYHIYYENKDSNEWKEYLMNKVSNEN